MPVQLAAAPCAAQVATMDVCGCFCVHARTRMRAFVCVRGCIRVRACVHTCVHACVRACVRACEGVQVMRNQLQLYVQRTLASSLEKIERQQVVG